MRAKVLVVDDDPSFSAGVKSALKSEKVEVTCVANPTAALQAYRESKMDFDLLMIDYHYESIDVTGAELALRIRQINPQQTIIFMTGFQDLNFVDSMFQTGVGRTFIRKGGGPDTIIAPVLKILREMKRDTSSDDTIEDEIKRTSSINAMGLIGRSRELYDVVKTVEQVRRFRSKFLVIGESGAGKELIAKAFGIKGKPFYSVDCGGFGESGEQFVDVQLFGRKKGAYTGADTDLKGAFEIANGGVIFLDELHCLSIGAQSKLLRTLQENKFRRLGDPTGPEIPFDVTVVAATQPIIFELMEREEFKKDLFFRLAKMEIKIPALSARRSDIKPLAEYFIKVYSKRHGLNRDPHPQLLRELEGYSWPGNVRELENFIEKLVMTSTEEILEPQMFRNYLSAKMINPTSENSSELDLKQIVKSVEADKIAQALSLSRTVGEAAKRLQIARTTLNDRMKKLMIDPRKFLKGTELGLMPIKQTVIW